MSIKAPKISVDNYIFFKFVIVWYCNYCKYLPMVWKTGISV